MGSTGQDTQRDTKRQHRTRQAGSTRQHTTRGETTAYNKTGSTRQAAQTGTQTSQLWAVACSPSHCGFTPISTTLRHTTSQHPKPIPTLHHTTSQNPKKPKHTQEIAKRKLPDTNATKLESACKMVEGTARSLGLVVVD